MVFVRHRGSQILAMVCLISLMGGASADAQLESPLRISLPFSKKVEWRPDADYSLTRNHGPWMIMCASFLGEQGEIQAQELVKELRSEFNLPAYIYRQRFDYSGPIEGKGWQLTPDKSWVEPQKMKHLHVDRFVEVAVLVGDYDKVDDGKAQKTLKKIKYINPQSLQITRENPTTQRMSVMRKFYQFINPDDEVSEKGPMGAAFVTLNPMLPDDYFNNGVDDFVVELNRGLDHSLLECRGRYTVQVASFKGESTFDLGEIQERTNEFNLAKLAGRGIKSKLAQAEVDAAHLANALRARGYEAYQYHTRTESIVTVGSFDWKTQELPNGFEQNNPEIEKVKEAFKARPQNVIDKSGQLIQGAMQPRSLDGIMFDIIPKVIDVPHARR